MRTSPQSSSYDVSLLFSGDSTNGEGSVTFRVSDRVESERLFSRGFEADFETFNLQRNSHLDSSAHFIHHCCSFSTSHTLFLTLTSFLPLDTTTTSSPTPHLTHNTTLTPRTQPNLAEHGARHQERRQNKQTPNRNLTEQSRKTLLGVLSHRHQALVAGKMSHVHGYDIKAGNEDFTAAFDAQDLIYADIKSTQANFYRFQQAAPEMGMLIGNDYAVAASEWLGRKPNVVDLGKMRMDVAGVLGGEEADARRMREFLGEEGWRVEKMERAGSNGDGDGWAGNVAEPVDSDGESVGEEEDERVRYMSCELYGGRPGAEGGHD